MNEKIILPAPINHIAFIMDGNGRWAKKRGLPRFLGHKEGCERIIEVFDLCKEYGVKVCSFYAFSTENWNRPKDEIDHLFNYLEAFFKREINHLLRDGVRVVISGDMSRLPAKTQKTCNEAIERTKDCPNYVMNICLNYGSRAEIVRAAKLLIDDVENGKVEKDAISEALFSDYLYTCGLPDVDLMIRTSGEERLSNYLLWQNAYSEFVFTPVHWPDFKREAFEDCLREYITRNRRFGGLKDEEK